MGSKNRSSGKKGGISLVKKKNIKGGKMSSGKKTKSKSVVKARRKLQAAVRKKLQQRKNGTLKPAEVEVNMDDILDMIDENDLKHLRGEEQKDRMYLVASEKSRMAEKSNKKRSKALDEDDLEVQYERQLVQKGPRDERKVNVLLPVKTSRGLQTQVVEDEVEPGSEPEEDVDEDAAKPRKVEVDKFPLKDKILSIGKLKAERKNTVSQMKVRIGTLATSFLEDPQNRMKNLDSLIAIMEVKDPSVSLTVPKLCIGTLLYVFRDVLPSYSIKHSGADGVKLKKDTLQLQTFENLLLSKYKMYLRKLEVIITKYCPRTLKFQERFSIKSSLGEVGLSCMCEMLRTHPYFNMSVNIAHFIIPYLNNGKPSVRKIVFDGLGSVFRIDKRGEISFEIVRRINELVKYQLKRNKVIHQDVLNIMLTLRIKEVDLNKEKEEEANTTKKLSFEQRRMLSKRQRKKSKDLVELEKELLEASAEENKEKKAHFLTEITKLVFTIYFRALKTDPSPTVLSATLEGISKFAHLINLELFLDILPVMQKFMLRGNMPQRQALLIIGTILQVYDGPGAQIKIDPNLFHQFLYEALSSLRCGKIKSDVDLAVRCTDMCVGKSTMPGPRNVAFAKRLATTSLQVEHHDAIAVLMELKNILRRCPEAAVLLDCDGSGGSGVYMPELNNPDHASANASTMWELSTLMNHYHHWVSQISRSIVLPNEKVPLELLKHSRYPHIVCEEMDPVPSMDFTPSLPVDNKFQRKRKSKFYQFRPKTELFQTLLKMAQEEAEELPLESLDFSFAKLK